MKTVNPEQSVDLSLSISMILIMLMRFPWFLHCLAYGNGSNLDPFSSNIWVADKGKGREGLLNDVLSVTAPKVLEKKLEVKNIEISGIELEEAESEIKKNY